ncbi:MAG: AAA family ATPase, partial [Candidatus Omnitrophota bacterium]
MITRLTIQNIGLIDSLAIEFRDRLNILTGETGAGKSILIDTLRFALGERMKTTKVRNPELPCTVEAVFEIPLKRLPEYDAFIEYFTNGGELIISRSYLPDGRSKAKINGFTVTLAQLKDLGDRLVDFHGPNDHQLLLSPESHLGILDRLSSVDIPKSDYIKKYQEYSDLLKQQQELKEMAVSRERELGTLAYQIKELGSVPLDEAKYEELMCEQKRLNNAEKISECINALIDTFEDGNTGVNEAISQAFGPMKTLGGIDESAVEFVEQLGELQDKASELLRCLTNYRDNLSFDPETAQAINLRSDIYYEIKRKYGPTLEDARAFYESIKQKHDLMADLE